MLWHCLTQGLGHYPEMIYGKNRAMFLASQTYTLSPHFHNIQYRKHFGTLFPLRAKHWISKIGQSSSCIAAEVYDKQGSLLSQTVITFVLIDKQTRKPTNLPEFVSQTYQKRMKSLLQLDIQKISPPKIPSTSFELKRKVLHSECDMNLHASQIFYLVWCSDAAAEAAKASRFNHFTRHLELYPLKCAEMHYLGEALANEEVTVNVWEDKEDPKRIIAAVCCKSRVIYHTVLEYYDGPHVTIEPHLESKL